MFIMDGDVMKAYDYTKHSRLIQGLRKKSVEDVIIAAIVRGSGGVGPRWWWIRLPRRKR